MAKFHGVEMGALNNSNIGGRYISHQFNTGGWTCAFCGGYTFYGTEHYCPSMPSVVPGYYNIPSDAKNIRITYHDPALIELQNLLRQLIERVDRLIETFESK